MLESVYQRKIIKEMEAKGYFVLKLVKTNKNGVPDLLCLKSGELPMFIEVKAKGGKLSELQKYRIKELIQLGFDAYVRISD